MYGNDYVPMKIKKKVYLNLSTQSSAVLTSYLSFLSMLMERNFLDAVFHLYSISQMTF
jgi:hypothetical protein